MALEGNIPILILLIALSAFFSAVETALVAVSRMKIRTALKHGLKGAEALARIKANPRRMITTILLCQNIVSITASALATITATEMFGPTGLEIAVGVMTFLFLVFGDIVPKSFATANAERIALATSETIELLQKILFPLVWFFERITRIFTGLYGTGGRTLTEDEIRTIVDMGFEDRAITADEKRLLTEVLDFRQLKAKDILVPKKGTVFLKAEESVESALKKMTSLPYSRYPVISKDGKIIGIATINQLIKSTNKGKKVGTVAKKALCSSKERGVMELLKEMQTEGEHMAIIVDEFGELEGIVTIQDLLEEFVGEFAGFSHGIEKKRIRRGKGIIASGEARLGDIEKAVGRNFAEEDAESLSLFLHKYLQRIPRQGDKILLKGVKIEVKKMDGNRLSSAVITRLE